MSDKTKPLSEAQCSATSCDWKYESDESRRCKHPATTINPPTGLKYCAAHTRRFNGMEDLVPIKPPNAPGERPGSE